MSNSVAWNGFRVAKGLHPDRTAGSDRQWFQASRRIPVGMSPHIVGEAFGQLFHSITLIVLQVVCAVNYGGLKLYIFNQIRPDALQEKHYSFVDKYFRADNATTIVRKEDDLQRRFSFPDFFIRASKEDGLHWWTPLPTKVGLGPLNDVYRQL